MSDERFDIEEIIAEIKSEHTTDQKSDSANNDSEKSSSRYAKHTSNPISRSSTKKHSSHESSEEKCDESHSLSPLEKGSTHTVSSSIAKKLDKVFSDTPTEKKQKSKQAEIIDVKDLAKKDTEENTTNLSHDTEDHKLFPYDVVNRVFSDPEEAVRILTAKLRSLSISILALFPIWLIVIYMTLVFPFNLPIPSWFSYFNTPFLYLLVFFIADVAAILLASDVTVSGFARLIHGKPTLDTLVLFASLSSMAYTLTVIIMPSWGGWLPFTSNTVSMCFFALVSKRRRYMSLKRTYRVMQQTSSPIAIKVQGSRRYKTAYKTKRNVFPEMEAISSRDATERVCSYYTPLIMLVTIALAVAASFGRQDAKSFTWCLSALSIMAISPALLISSSLPSSIISRRLFTSGTALVNSRSTFKLSKSRSAILTDEDIFPNGSISITSLNIDSSFSREEVHSVMASCLEAIGGGLYSVFESAAKQLYAHKKRVEDIRFFENGGMSAKIGSDFILIGTESFLRRMGVKVIKPKLSNCLFISINSRYAGVFSLKYNAQTPVYCGFRHLRRAKATPILAVRDFTATEAFIEDKFKLHAEEAEYPSMAERVQYSDDRFSDSEPLAVLSHSNMSAFAELLLGCRKLTRSVIFNLICSFMGSIVGMIIMYFLVSAASPVNVLVYLGCWSLPVWLSSLIFTAF